MFLIKFKEYSLNLSHYCVLLSDFWVMIFGTWIWVITETNKCLFLIIQHQGLWHSLPSPELRSCQPGACSFQWLFPLKHPVQPERGRRLSDRWRSFEGERSFVYRRLRKADGKPQWGRIRRVRQGLWQECRSERVAHFRRAKAKSSHRKSHPPKPWKAPAGRSHISPRFRERKEGADLPGWHDEREDHNQRCAQDRDHQELR